MADLKPSIRATYDSAKTGPAYRLTTRINGRTNLWRKPIDDPFARTTVRVGLWGCLSALLRGRPVVVEVLVDAADPELLDDVLELDEQTLISGRTRRAAFQQSMHSKIAAAGEVGDAR